MKVPYEVRKLLYADPNISDAAKTLFTVLAGFTKGGETDCDLPNETIAKAAGMLRRSAERPYAELRKAGWITYAELRGSYRKIALAAPQNCVGTIRKIAEPIKEVPVKNQILTRKPKKTPSASRGTSGNDGSMGLSGDRLVDRTPVSHPATVGGDGKHGFESHSPAKEAKDFAWETFKSANDGNAPTWDRSDWTQFSALIKRVSVEEFKRRWHRFLASDEPFVVGQGMRLRWFCTNFDRFKDGPVMANRPKHFDLQADEVTNATLRKYYQQPAVVRPALQDVPRADDRTDVKGLSGGTRGLLGDGDSGRGEGGKQGIRQDAKPSADPKIPAGPESLADRLKRLEALRTMR